MRRELNFNIKKFIFQITPSLLRKTVQLAWLNCLLEPLKTNWEVFVEYRKRAFLEANATPQTIVLENYINQVLGEKEEQKIKILHSKKLILDLALEEEGFDPIYLSLEADGIEDVNLGLEGDQFLPDGVDFVIEVYDENIKQGDIEVILKDFNIINNNYQIIYK